MRTRLQNANMLPEFRHRSAALPAALRTCFSGMRTRFWNAIMFFECEYFSGNYTRNHIIYYTIGLCYLLDFEHASGMLICVQNANMPPECEHASRVPRHRSAALPAALRTCFTGMRTRFWNAIMFFECEHCSGLCTRKLQNYIYYFYTYIYIYMDIFILFIYIYIYNKRV